MGIVETAADYNLKILAPLARFFKEAGRLDDLEAICRAARIAPADFESSIRWVSFSQFEAFHVAARARVASDEEFTEVCAHHMAVSYGPLRFFFWATTPLLLFKAIERGNRFFTSVGTFSIVNSGPNFVRLRYSSERPESRLVCLSRQAQSAMGPTLWGMPRASVRERKCMAHGDECCEYEFHWFSRPRWLPAMLGFAMGALGSWAATRAGMGSAVAAVSLPLLGAVVAQARELARTERANRATQAESTEALRLMVDDAAEVRRELLALHERQREWSQLIEGEAAQRAETIEAMSNDLKRLQAERAATVRGFSHDLRNPLQLLRGTIDALREGPPPSAAETKSTVDDLEDVYARMCSLLDQLMRVVTSRREFMAFAPKRLDVGPLGERLLRRVRALVHGRDIRTSVFSTREAPDAIHIDLVVLDRIVDNLLTNAAKYTDRGSILIEIDGHPGFLVLKISDTGRGMSDDELGRAFSPGGSSESERAPKSFGLGLSVVVGLLARLGGRIEVMSKVGKGSTFWVYLPVGAETEAGEPGVTSGEVVALSEIVRVRRTA
ncbi:MAG: hypothetical protein IPG50_23120 [Myxococcales bacterium]|nr:hypothetical protein [Myxococcales bacterium]